MASDQFLKTLIGKWEGNCRTWFEPGKLADESKITGEAIMFSQGARTERGFSVRGDYDVGQNQPKWGWRTEYTLIDANHLTITAYNIPPQGTEYKAVEVTYQRVR